MVQYLSAHLVRISHKLYLTILLLVPVFVVSHADESATTANEGRIAGVNIAAIRYVVAILFHPVAQRKLPEQKLARPDRQWVDTGYRQNHRKSEIRQNSLVELSQ